jgi:hypothetical protein
MEGMTTRAFRSATLSLCTACAVGLLAVGIFLALHPMVRTFFSERFLGGSYGDGGLYVWLTQFFASDPRSALSFETNALYPYPRTRAWSDSFLLPSLVSYLLMQSGVSLAAAYNIVLLLALGANAGATYLLARKLGLEQVFAVAVGLIFANSSYLLGNIGHPQLLFFFWIPLAWSLVIPAAQNQRAKTHAWLAAGLCITGAFYSAVYYAVFIAIGLAIVWIAESVCGVASTRRSLRTLLSCAVGALPVVYALPAYLAVQGYFGSRGLYEAEAFSASGLSYLSYSSFHDLYAATSHLSHSEAQLGVGYILTAIAVLGGGLALVRIASVAGALCALSLAVLCSASSIVDLSQTQEWLVTFSTWAVLVCALLVARRIPAPRGVCFVILSVFLVLSFGPGGNPVKGEPAYTPLAILYDRIPGLSAIRAVSRFGSVVVLGLIIGAAQVVQSLLAGEGSQRISTKGAIGACLLCGVGLLENSVSTLPFDAPSPAPQAVVEYAKQSNSNGAVVFLPFSGSLDEQRVPRWSEFAVLNTRYAQWSSLERPFSTVNGYSGQRSKIQGELAQALESFPSQKGFDALAKICGVSSILVTPQGDVGALGADINARAFPDQIASVERFDDGSAIVKLLELQVSVEPNLPRTFFAPRKQAAILSVEPAAGSTCEVKLQSVGKSEEDKLQPIHEESFAVSQTQELRVVAPAKLQAGSPHIISVSVSGCTARVSCRVQ